MLPTKVWQRPLTCLILPLKNSFKPLIYLSVMSQTQIIMINTAVRFKNRLVFKTEQISPKKEAE